MLIDKVFSADMTIDTENIESTTFEKIKNEVIRELEKTYKKLTNEINEFIHNEKLDGKVKEIKYTYEEKWDKYEPAFLRGVLTYTNEGEYDREEHKKYLKLKSKYEY